MIVIKAKESEIEFVIDERKAQITLRNDELFGDVVHIDYPPENLVVEVGMSKIDYHINGGAQLGSLYEESKEMESQFIRLKNLAQN